jgi:hypothetical protein
MYHTPSCFSQPLFTVISYSLYYRIRSLSETLFKAGGSNCFLLTVVLGHSHQFFLAWTFRFRGEIRSKCLLTQAKHFTLHSPSVKYIARCTPSGNSQEINNSSSASSNFMTMIPKCRQRALIMCSSILDIVPHSLKHR